MKSTSTSTSTYTTPRTGTRLITLDEALALATLSSRMQGLMSADELADHLAASDDWQEEDFDAAYERHIDYKMWLRDCGQPAHAF